MSNNLNKQLADLTQINDTAIDYIYNTVPKLILHDIYNAAAEGKDYVEYDIGIGTLEIDWRSGKVEYNIRPSILFRKSIDKVLTDGEDLFTLDIEQKLNSVITNLYKELI